MFALVIKIYDSGVCYESVTEQRASVSGWGEGKGCLDGEGGQETSRIEHRRARLAIHQYRNDSTHLLLHHPDPTPATLTASMYIGVGRGTCATAVVAQDLLLDAELGKV